ncbi:TraR/DksA family transcriptional regulator [Aggregicoccus sp. 17bor-14]|uniref:TraR/DksA family transcriptional regulator n=1 Tax=Myxococcaceae TaxID=31 RepID=UPI00129CE0BE|nr:MULTISPECIES: TraR/DksA family transcriptional regulator [Myxococcaceae]MBF5041531.1 TraR/DksA family transcriptional regulator [Simulacricoccus sp. 17bor-14]MRI87316.1 TraR/DksA family transcriptional regulator [Aggregicoccus sp. 17bor-14]
MGQATQLTREDVERLTARLRAEYDRLTAMHADSRPDPDPAQADPGDDADLAEDQRRDTVSVSHTDVDDRELAQVRRALDKLAEGTYGVSDLTDEPIPLARLEAIPWATANVDELEDGAPAGVRDV